MNPRFATYDDAALGPSLEVLQSGEVVTVTNTGLNLNRTARGNIGVTGDTHYWEQVVWGEDTMEAVLGIVNQDAILSAYPGGDANGIGYDLAAGTIKVNGSSVASVGAATQADVLGFLLELEGPAPGLTFFRNDITIHFEPITPGDTWYIGTALGSTSGVAADWLQAFLNTGQRAFEYPNPASLGWFEVPPEIDTLWLGTVDWITAPTDVPANQRVEGVVPLGDASFTIKRRLAFWPQGEGAATRPDVASLTILDPTGAYDELISGNVRDLPVTIYDVPDRFDGVTDAVTLADATVIGTYLIDRVEAVSDMRKRLVFKDNAVRFDNPLQKRLFLPNVDPTAANRVWPISLGAALSVPPVYWKFVPDDAAGERYYALHDEALLGVGFVRDKGDPLDPSVPDYAITPDWQGIILYNNPDGKLTADVSSMGGDVPLPPTSLAPPLLASWDASSNVTQGGGQYTFADSEVTDAGTVEAYLKRTAILGAGVTYRYRIVVDSMTGFFGTTGQRTRLQFIRAIGGGNVPQLQLGVEIVEAGTYTGTFTNASAGTNDFYLAMVGTQSGADQIKIDQDIQLFEVSNEDVTSDNLLPIGLADFVYEIIEKRGGFGAQEWDRASFEAIDDYAGIGWHTAEQVPVRQALEESLPSWGACISQDRNGVFRGYRIEAPELRLAESPSTLMGEINDFDLLSDLQIQTDEARSLTTRFSFRRNELVLDATDFVDDYDDVPLTTRKQLGRQYREVESNTAGRLAGAYVSARSAPPLETRFFLAADTRKELVRVLNIYPVERKFFTAEVPFDSDYDLDQLWMLVYPRYGLNAGKPVIVWGITEDRINRKAILTLWG